MATRRPKLQVRPNIGRRPRPVMASQSEASMEKSDPPADTPETSQATADKVDTPPPPPPQPAGDEIKQVDKTDVMDKGEEKKTEPVSTARRRLIKPKVQIGGARKPRPQTGKEEKSEGDDRTKQNVEPEATTEKTPPEAMTESTKPEVTSQKTKLSTEEAKNKGKDEALYTMEEEEAAQVVVQSPIKMPNDVVAMPAKDKPTENENSKESTEPEKAVLAQRNRFRKVVPNLSTERKRYPSISQGDVEAPEEFQPPPAVQRIAKPRIASPPPCTSSVVPQSAASSVSPSGRSPKAAHSAGVVPSASPPHKASKAAPSKTSRTSYKHAEKTEEKKTKRGFRRTKPLDEAVDASKLTMRDLIYLNPTSNRMKEPVENEITLSKLPGPEAMGGASAPGSSIGSPREGDSAPTTAPGTREGTPEKDAEEEEGDVLAPQVMINDDGQIVLQESSLTVEREVQPTIDDLDMDCKTDDHKIGYGKRSRVKQWTRKETKKFYIALSSIGTDFSLMSSLFPDRDRTQLKRKFKLEDKKYRHLVDKALSQRKEFDMALFDNISSSEEEEEVVKKKPAPKPKKPKPEKPPKEKKEKKEKKKKETKSKANSKVKSKAIIEDSQDSEDEIVPAKRKKPNVYDFESSDESDSEEQKKKQLEEEKAKEDAKRSTPVVRLPPVSTLFHPSSPLKSPPALNLDPSRVLSLSNINPAKIQPGQFVFISQKNDQDGNESDSKKSKDDQGKRIHVYMVSPPPGTSAESPGTPSRHFGSPARAELFGSPARKSLFNSPERRVESDMDTTEKETGTDKPSVEKAQKGAKESASEMSKETVDSEKSDEESSVEKEVSESESSKQSETVDVDADTEKDSEPPEESSNQSSVISVDEENDSDDTITETPESQESDATVNDPQSPRKETDSRPSSSQSSSEESSNSSKPVAATVATVKGPEQSKPASSTSSVLSKETTTGPMTKGLRLSTATSTKSSGSAMLVITASTTKASTQVKPKPSVVDIEALKESVKASNVVVRHRNSLSITTEDGMEIQAISDDEVIPQGAAVVDLQVTVPSDEDSISVGEESLNSKEVAAPVVDDTSESEKASSKDSDEIIDVEDDMGQVDGSLEMTIGAALTTAHPVEKDVVKPIRKCDKSAASRMEAMSDNNVNTKKKSYADQTQTNLDKGVTNDKNASSSKKSAVDRMGAQLDFLLSSKSSQGPKSVSALLDAVVNACTEADSSKSTSTTKPSIQSTSQKSVPSTKASVQSKPATTGSRISRVKKDTMPKTPDSDTDSIKGTTVIIESESQDEPKPKKRARMWDSESDNQQTDAETSSIVESVQACLKRLRSQDERIPETTKDKATADTDKDTMDSKNVAENNSDANEHLQDNAGLTCKITPPKKATIRGRKIKALPNINANRRARNLEKELATPKPKGASKSSDVEETVSTIVEQSKTKPSLPSEEKSVPSDSSEKNENTRTPVDTNAKNDTVNNNERTEKVPGDKEESQSKTAPTAPSSTIRGRKIRIAPNIGGARRARAASNDTPTPENPVVSKSSEDTSSKNPSKPVISVQSKSSVEAGTKKVETRAVPSTSNIQLSSNSDKSVVSNKSAKQTEKSSADRVPVNIDTLLDTFKQSDSEKRTRKQSEMVVDSDCSEQSGHQAIPIPSPKTKNIRSRKIKATPNVTAGRKVRAVGKKSRESEVFDQSNSKAAPTDTDETSSITSSSSGSYLTDDTLEKYTSLKSNKGRVKNAISSDPSDTESETPKTTAVSNEPPKRPTGLKRSIMQANAQVVRGKRITASPNVNAVRRGEKGTNSPSKSTFSKQSKATGKAAPSRRVTETTESEDDDEEEDSDSSSSSSSSSTDFPTIGKPLKRKSSCIGGASLDSVIRASTSSCSAADDSCIVSTMPPRLPQNTMEEDACVIVDSSFIHVPKRPKIEQLDEDEEEEEEEVDEEEMREAERRTEEEKERQLVQERKEKEEQERLEKEQLEKERLEKERREKQRLEEEKEKKRLEFEKRQAEREIEAQKSRIKLQEQKERAIRLEEEKRLQREKEVKSQRPLSNPQLSSLTNHIGLSRAQASAFRPVILSPPIKAPKNLKVQEYVNRTLFGGSATFGNQGNNTSRTSNTNPAMRQSLNGLVLMGGDAFRKYEEKRTTGGNIQRPNSSQNRPLSSMVSPHSFDYRQSPQFAQSASTNSVHNPSSRQAQSPVEFSTPFSQRLPQEPTLSPRSFPRMNTPKPNLNQSASMDNHGGISPDIFSRLTPVGSRLGQSSRRNSVDNLSAKSPHTVGHISPRDQSSSSSLHYSPRYVHEPKPTTYVNPAAPRNIRNAWREVREVKQRPVSSSSSLSVAPAHSPQTNVPVPAVKQETKPAPYFHQLENEKEYTIRTIIQNGQLVCVVEDS